MAKVYVASSWRNARQPCIVATLRDAGHEVYDFRNPLPGDRGFHWSDIDPDWKQWTPAQLREALDHPIAVAGYRSDKEAMDWADVCVLVMPCGRSAHLEAGYFSSGMNGKELVILLSDGEPELMYNLADHVCVTMDEVLEVLVPEPPKPRKVLTLCDKCERGVSGYGIPRGCSHGTQLTECGHFEEEMPF